MDEVVAPPISELARRELVRAQRALSAPEYDDLEDLVVRNPFPEWDFKTRNILQKAGNEGWYAIVAVLAKKILSEIESEFHWRSFSAIRNTSESFLELAFDKEYERDQNEVVRAACNSDSPEIAHFLVTVGGVSRANLLSSAAEDGRHRIVTSFKFLDACLVGHLEIAHNLIASRKDANVDFRLGIDGMTPLHMAALHNNLPLAQLLLRNGADVDLEWNNQTPLQIAFAKNSIGVVSTLLAHMNADPVV